MEKMRRPSIWVLLGLILLTLSLHDFQANAEVGPSESECRPYIEKALNELKTEADGVDSNENEANDDDGTSIEDIVGEPIDGDDKNSNEKDETADADDNSSNQADDEGGSNNTKENDGGDDDDDAKVETAEQQSNENEASDSNDNSLQDNNADEDDITDNESGEAQHVDDDDSEKNSSGEDEDDVKSGEDAKAEKNDDDGDDNAEDQSDETETQEGENSTEDPKAQEEEDDGQSAEETKDAASFVNGHSQEAQTAEDTDGGNSKEAASEEEIVSRRKRDLDTGTGNDDDDDSNEEAGTDDKDRDSVETTDTNNKEASAEEKESSDGDDDDDDPEKSNEDATDSDADTDDGDDDKPADGSGEDNENSEETRPEDDLLLEFEIPDNLRDRTYIDELLHLDNESEDKETAVDRVADIILRDLKRIYESAIKPLEALYKYRDLSNRHFGDPEIFSKPLILFMGPWSGGKSSIINYLTDNEYTVNSLRTGAEPSPAYFNILMHGDQPEVLDGTQLAADWTFSGLQKFGQGLEDRLRGLKLPNKLLEKVNIVEIPGILEVRKQVQRLFPFNDACQWFIDRADIIFLVYDPAKLDVGPETEAILDQLKGREYQTRIVLNKADLVKPEELLRVQGALIWNISPLMSSAQPPVMYTTSLWSHPYETSSPVRLLQAQERAFLRDLRTSIDKRIENKIASARRFAVRVRNHAKMVDCYLTTYYNHKTLFGNKKRIADQIIEHPQDYHIYEGLSTLTNISRYDLPDPEVYRDFFRLNPVYEFKKLSETCTYFRGCPINKLDVAIAYDLPELVGKYKKLAEQALIGGSSTATPTEADSAKGES